MAMSGLIGGVGSGLGAGLGSGLGSGVGSGFGGGFGYDVHGFTILTEDERYDESDMLDRSIAALGVRHTGLRADPTDYLDNMKVLVDYPCSVPKMPSFPTN